MINQRKIVTSLFLCALLTQSSLANTEISEIDKLNKLEKEIQEIIDTEKLNNIAKDVKKLNLRELEKLESLIDKEEVNESKNKSVHTHHKHIVKETKNPLKVSVKSPIPKKKILKTTSKISKIKEILTKLGTLAQKEGTDSACTFCSAILKDVTLNKVEVVDMAQDWVTLRIQKGNTLSSFAKNYYGNASAYKEIYKLNKKSIGKNNILYAGNQITIPRVETLEKQNKKQALSCKFCAALLKNVSLKKVAVLNVGKNSIQVKIKKGDTLSGLALKYYKKPWKYKVIYNANRDKISANYQIHVGDILEIPSL